MLRIETNTPILHRVRNGGVRGNYASARILSLVRYEAPKLREDPAARPSRRFHIEVQIQSISPLSSSVIRRHSLSRSYLHVLLHISMRGTLVGNPSSWQFSPNQYDMFEYTSAWGGRLWLVLAPGLGAGYRRVLTSFPFVFQICAKLISPKVLQSDKAY